MYSGLGEVFQVTNEAGVAGQPASWTLDTEQVSNACGSIYGIQQILRVLGYPVPMSGQLDRTTTDFLNQFAIEHAQYGIQIMSPDYWSQLCDGLRRAYEEKSSGGKNYAGKTTPLPAVFATSQLSRIRTHVEKPEPKKKASEPVQWEHQEPEPKGWWEGLGTTTKAAIILGLVGAAGGGGYYYYTKVYKKKKR